jgi:hypothetical protein
MVAVEASILGVAPLTLDVVVSRAALVTKDVDIREEEGFRGAMASKVAATRRRAAGREPVGEAPISCKVRVATWGPQTTKISASLGCKTIRGTMDMALVTMEVMVHSSSVGRVIVHTNTVLGKIMLACNHGRVLTLIYFSRQCKQLSPRSRQQQRSQSQLRLFLRRFQYLEELGSLRSHLL